MLGGSLGASGGSNGTHDDSHSPRSTPSSSADLHGHQSPGLSVKTEQIKHEAGGPSETTRAQLNGMFDASTEAAMQQMAAATANVDPFGVTRGNPLYAGVRSITLNICNMTKLRIFILLVLVQSGRRRHNVCRKPDVQLFPELSNRLLQPDQLL